MKKGLNLFAGIGGNRLPWTIPVTAVEIEPRIADIYQKRYPSDVVVVADAYEYLVGHFHEFDFIWASPPCPSHSKMSRTHVGRRYNGWDMKVQLPDLRLYSIIIFLNNHFRGDWIVENVDPFYDALKSDSIPVPSRIGRHLFWSNKQIPEINIDTEAIMFKYKNDDNHYEEYLQEMCSVFEIDRDLVGKVGHNWGYNHDGIGQILRNAIHPKIARYLWECVNSTSKPVEMGALR